MSYIFHAIYKYRGLLYCNKCGARCGVNQIRKLARPCEAITGAGKLVLGCINKGIRPPGVDMWPSWVVLNTRICRLGSLLGSAFSKGTSQKIEKGAPSSTGVAPIEFGLPKRPQKYPILSLWPQILGFVATGSK